MSAVVIVGAQWGDEGKGKVVDIYTEFAQMVVRYAGGANAGHTLVVGDEKIVVRLLPSGVLRPETRCVLGQGMVVDLSVLFKEVDELKGRGRSHVETQLSVSDRAHLILPYHQTVDALREAAARPDRAIGTTKKGIGPAYEDKVRRVGIRAGDLRDMSLVREKIGVALENWAPTLKALGGDVPGVDEIVDGLSPYLERTLKLLSDTSALVDQAIRQKQRVLFEGAQGTLLDIDNGTYPFVTSSSPTSGGAASGAGIGPNRIDTVVGLVKAYTTRVGSGPFPTELSDSSGEHLAKVGDEFGAVTGRPRRTGWLDMPALRYAARVNGIDGLAITKLDVLTGLEKVKVCVAYDTPDGRTEDLPIHLFGSPALKPVYEELPGWKEELSETRVLSDLPENARAYIRFMEERSGVPAYTVGVGPRRRETIMLHNPFVGRADAP